MHRNYLDSKSSSIESSSGACSRSITYIQVKVLGQGSFGRAVLYRNTSDNILVVWKQIQMPNNCQRKRLLDIHKEIEILAMLEHPNIIGYYSHFVHKEVLHIEMEYANGNGLNRYIAELALSVVSHNDVGGPVGGLLSQDEILWLFFQLIGAVSYLHRRHIVHRDIKPHNIFLCQPSPFLVKLGDFGVAKQLEEGEMAETQIGTPLYMAPEILKGLSYSYHSDLWACGCVLYELLTLRTLFESSNQLSLVLKITEGQFQPMPRSGEYSTALLELLGRLLCQEPHQRLTSQGVLDDAVWTGAQPVLLQRVQSISQQRMPFGPIPLSIDRADRQRREVVSLNSETLIWGGGKMAPVWLDLFRDNLAALRVSAGEQHCAVITVEGQLFTWSTPSGDGSTLTGQLGHGSSQYKTPKLVADLVGCVIQQVSCGAENTYCLSIQGELYGCGSNYYGQLGLSSISQDDYTDRFQKIPIVSPNTGEIERLVQLSCGRHHVMVLADDERSLYSWGCGEFGRLGLGCEDDRAEPSLVRDVCGLTDRICKVVCGPDCSFLVVAETGRLLACGNNECNKLGVNSTAQGLASEQVSYDVPFETLFRLVLPARRLRISALSCGDHHTALVDSCGHLFLMGSNKFGQLGQGDTRPHPGICRAGRSIAGKSIVRAECGDKFTVIATADNELYAWGLAENGRLGASRAGSSSVCQTRPMALFGVLWQCADLSCRGWLTLMIAERKVSADSPSADLQSVDWPVNPTDPDGDSITQRIRDNMDSNISNSEASTSGTNVHTWLRAELEDAEVIPMNAIFDSHHHNRQDNTGAAEGFFCNCGCKNCSDHIKQLQNRVLELEDKLK